MPTSRLELIASHGDQTLANIRFVVHGTANGADARAILARGLRFVEGRPTGVDKYCSCPRLDC